jgi:hypothetical protein
VKSKTLYGWAASPRRVHTCRTDLLVRDVDAFPPGLVRLGGERHLDHHPTSA